MWEAMSRAGSIQHFSGRIDFVLVEQDKGLPVSYVGTDSLPDTFKDGSQCLVEGRVEPDGRFVAEVVQAECASKSEVAPGQKQSAGSGTGDSIFEEQELASLAGGL